MSQRSAFKLLSLVVLLSLAIQPIAPVLAQQTAPAPAVTAVQAPDAAAGVLFRTTVTVDSPARRARLEALGVTGLTVDDGTKDEV